MTASLLVIGGVAGWLSVLYGWPRRLVGHESVFVLDTWHSRFVTRQSWADDYATVGAVVRASGAHRVGVVEGFDSWEYPWWLLLPGRQLLAFQSQLPHRPPASAKDVDVIVCSVPVAECRGYVPGTWLIHEQGILSYAFPPGRP